MFSITEPSIFRKQGQSLGAPSILQTSLPGMFQWISVDSLWHSSPQTQAFWSILWHGNRNSKLSEGE